VSVVTAFDTDTIPAAASGDDPASRATSPTSEKSTCMFDHLDAVRARRARPGAPRACTCSVSALPTFGAWASPARVARRYGDGYVCAKLGLMQSARSLLLLYCPGIDGDVCRASCTRTFSGRPVFALVLPATRRASWWETVGEVVRPRTRRRSSAWPHS
jgi:hypothetical protein